MTRESGCPSASPLPSMGPYTYNNVWNVEGELPQLDDPGEHEAADPESDSEEEVAPPEGLEAEPESNAVVLGRGATSYSTGSVCSGREGKSVC